MSFYKCNTFLPRLGKMTCDRYDWIEKKYDRDVITLPFAFFESNELKSVSSECETFAIIISRQWTLKEQAMRYCGGPGTLLGVVEESTSNRYVVTERIWIFNETNGIIEVPSLEATSITNLTTIFDKLVTMK